jgi:hypothetical protein
LSASVNHSFVREVLQRVTQRRISYLASCSEEMGLTHEEALDRAVLVYAALLGLVQLTSEGTDWLSDDRLQAITQQLSCSLLPDS